MQPFGRKGTSWQLTDPLNIIRWLIDSYQQSTLEVAVIECWCHQKGMDEISEKNRKADLAAKVASRKPLTENMEAPLIWEDSLRELKLQYTPAGKEWALARGHSLHTSGWIQTNEGKLFLHEASRWKVIWTRHWAFQQMTQQLFIGKNLLRTTQQVMRACEIC